LQTAATSEFLLEVLTRPDPKAQIYADEGFAAYLDKDYAKALRLLEQAAETRQARLEFSAKVFSLLHA
jgi:hypothetical protein